MKITMGQVRKLLREAKPDPKQRAFDRGMPHNEKIDTSPEGDLKVGDWVLVQDHRGHGKPHAGEIKGFTQVHAKDKEPYVTINVGFGGHSTERRYDMWRAEDFVGMATEEDVANAKDAWERERAWMARNIDTSREGT